MKQYFLHTGYEAVQVILREMWCESQIPQLMSRGLSATEEGGEARVSMELSWAGSPKRLMQSF